MSSERTLGTMSCVAVVLAAVGYFGFSQVQAARVHVTTPAAPSQAVSSQQPSNPVASAVSNQRGLLNRYCITCHNERRQTAGLMLDKMDPEQVSGHAEAWEKVVRKLRSGAMPPAGAPRADRVTFDAFASSLEAALDRAALTNPNPGQPTAHRLNRAEYTNAIRDLLVMDIDGRSFLPADDSGHGFDNNADVLSVSPALLERYLLAARKVVRLAIGDPTIRPTVETYRMSPLMWQDDRMSEDLPFGTRGGIAIRHHFPLDGEYVLRIHLERAWARVGIRGIDEENHIEVRLDGARIKLFTVGGKLRREKEEEYRKATGADEEYRRTADAGLEVRFAAKAGTRLVGVAFLKRTSVATEGVGPVHLPASSIAGAADATAQMRIESVAIGGPYDAQGPGDTVSRRRIFVCYPSASHDEESCAKTILSTLARRAYRRPVGDQDVQTLLGFYRAGRLVGGFEGGIGRALERILLSPYFLFRIERDPANVPPGTVYRLSDLELATRLSFFLWSSIPDEELLNVAEAGTLKDPAVLERQVRRMLRDTRATALMSNFGGQWLQVRNLRAVGPNPVAFPEFDDNLREAFQRETELFFESLLREDRPLLDLLEAKDTFVNERLARHYRIPNIYGSHFRRVMLSDDARRGVLGHGSVLTVTSYATRTSPVLRGKWVLENLLGAPPPPPPPNVPALKENDASSSNSPVSVRERLEQHRKNPACASCHAQMDQLGFALENLDAVGRWRTTEDSIPIDASAVLPDGTKFDGFAGLRKVLLSHREQFVTTVIEKLLTYALGRGIEHYDGPGIRQIKREAARNDYRWSSVILEIVQSTPFQMRTSKEAS